ncbi:MAG: hypothetical protein E7Z76_02400 [Methanobrevibacter sp.]|nr:hypothetical protein [Methanobrevibacter sp.]
MDNMGYSNDIVASNSGSSDNGVIGDFLTDDDVVAAGEGNNSASISTELNVSDSHFSKSATYFKVTLKDKSGNALINQLVSLSLEGKSYSAYTDVNGIALIKANALKMGTYVAVVNYAGSANYSSSSISRSVKVFSSAIGKDVSKYYGYTSTYKVTFWKDCDPLANTKVTFKINGKKYTKTTDANGVAKLNIKRLPAGKYTISTTNPYSGEKIYNSVVVKKDKTTIKPKSKSVIPNVQSSVKLLLKSKHKVLIKNAKVSFKYNNKTVTAKTNKKGIATIPISPLKEGSYKISYKFDGTKNYYSDSGKGYLTVNYPSTKLTASALKMNYNDGSKFKAKLTNNGKAFANKVIKFKINGKSLKAKTNSKGIAKVAIGDIAPGTYKMKYAYSSKGSYGYASGSKNVVISKAPVVLTANDLVMNYNDGSQYEVTVKDKSGNPLKNVNVKSTIDGAKYSYKTNSKGIAKLNITNGVGYYSIKTSVSDKCYSSDTVTKNILVNGTKIVGNDKIYDQGTNVTYKTKLVDAKDKPLENKTVVFTFEGKSYNKTTNSSGIAEINLGVLSDGDYSINYTYESVSGSSDIQVGKTVTVKQIVAASKKIKTYVEKHGKLPSNVKIGDTKFSISDYLYLASKAIVNINSGKGSKVIIKHVNDPTKPKGASDLGKFTKFVTLAKKIIKYADDKGKMPNYAKTKIGKIGFKGIVYAFSRILNYYGGHSKLPSSVEIKSLNSNAPTKYPSSLAIYLKASTNCQVNNAKIKSVVNKVIKGCKSNKEKATALFNYVRDTISYSFYYDTRYGAVGTLNAKKGNCVDHSHLLVAMFRTANLPARYVHGTCVFSSGGVYGHVWTQVYVDGNWVVADATSSRNSFGKIVNWNTHSYSLKGHFASIAF